MLPSRPLLRHDRDGEALSRRQTILAVLLLLVPLPFLTSPTYAGSSDLHSATEVIGAAIGLVAGLTFLHRSRALDDQAHLFFGAAFFANAAVDVVHGLTGFLVSRGMLALPQDAIDRVVPGTYLAGRTVAAVVLLLAPTLVAHRTVRFRAEHVWRVALTVVAGGVAITVLLSVLPPPPVQFPSRVIGRPADLLPAVLFAVASVRLYRWHRRSSDPMTWWVALAAAAAATGELWMSFSDQLYDIHFDTAHGYKVLGYLLPLVGLSIHQVQLIAQRERLTRELRARARELGRANRELEEANAVKSEFVSTVSHELRTPLAAILGFASSMREFWDDTPEDEKREQLVIIERQGGRLARLIDDLLEMSRLESGSTDVSTTDVDLAAVTRRVVGDLGDRVSGVEIEVAAGTVARGGEEHVERILINYLVNAMTYGAPPIRITSEESPPGTVTLAVSDAGEGVEPGFRDRLFESFTQADAGHTRRSHGTGLGLAIVQGLSQAQGGTAWFEPNEPTGARFLLRLPAARR